MNINRLVLTVIVLIAVFLRLYNLSSVPPQATVDEVSIGYNAYSILHTGNDEYGTTLPVLLRAYDDWRPALYVYLAIPFVKVLGLNVLAVRLPSVLLSIVTVVAVYFLVKYLTQGARFVKLKSFNLDIPIVTAFLFAISPWHIYLSRLGHEVNASFSFLILGLLFFMRFIHKEKWNLYLSALFFGLSFDSYQSTKFVIPFLLLSLGLLFFRKIMKNKITVLLSVILGILIIMPMILSIFDDNALIRFKGTSLVGNSPSYFEKVADRYFSDKQNGDLLGYVFDNKKAASILFVSHAYISHFNPVWLFFNEGEDAFKSPNLGLLYLFEFPLIFISLLFILKIGIPHKNIVLIFLWGLISILPGSVTTGYPHAMRIYNFLPIPQILASAGFISVLLILRKKEKYIFICISLAAAIFSLLWFTHSYFKLLPRELSGQFQYGVIRALSYTDSIDGNYKKVFVSNRDHLFESYMFYLYFKKYDPVVYQMMGGTFSGGFDKEHILGKYVFGDVRSKIKKGNLYIMNPNEYEDLARYYNVNSINKNTLIKLNVLSKISYLNNETALFIIETK